MNMKKTKTFLCEPLLPNDTFSMLIFRNCLWGRM
jgi:hypothetical protein